LIISVSAVVLLGGLVWLLIRYAGLRVWQALVCTLFGFFVASTAAAPQIHAAISAVVGVLAGH